MSTIQKSLLWAAAIIIFALIGAFGPVENDTFKSMFFMLPVLAWATIGQRRSCLPCPISRTGEKS
ncbi:hypothetical protein [Aurantiacibacter sediminis]|uniref:Uncharacterized protein n=1 Tax=Aurantiacibacter sediminis TaxID=2793064 RepID=A0ABS0MZD4_9SPHN|nr:hypothetical protein [Aurantiacibacter sediminis]MBH5321076.1 hypothetical protein [Aurantiacibacter sediminis]